NWILPESIIENAEESVGHLLRRALERNKRFSISKTMLGVPIERDVNGVLRDLTEDQLRTMNPLQREIYTSVQDIQRRNLESSAPPSVADDAAELTPV